MGLLGFTRLHPAVYTAVADAAGRGHIGPRPKARLLLAAQLGEQRLFAGAGGGAGRPGASGATARCPSLSNEGFECGAHAGRIGSVDVNLVGLSVQREVHSLFGVSPVNIIGQLYYHRFCHICIMADRGPLGELQERSGKTLAPRPLILYLGKKSPYLLRTPGLEFSKTRSYGRGPPGRRNRLDRHRAQAFFPYPNCAIRHSGVVLVGFGCLGAPDSTPFPPPSDHGASRPFRPLSAPPPPNRLSGCAVLGQFRAKMGW